MEDRPALLIDARNALYRAIYAVKADRRHKVKYHYFVALLRQITSWINIYKPESIHIFWDAPRRTVWRRKILESYKDRSDNQYIEDISEELAKTTAVAKAMFPNLNVRQYDKKAMEADDLVYAAVCMLHPQKTVIVSTDGDMTQIPFNYDSCVVYHPSKHQELETPDINPAIQKAIVGDKSDSILGYYGIGPKKSAAMINDRRALNDFLDSNGRKIYHTNLLLIDLSLNPKLMHNKLYVQKKLAEDVCYDEKAIKELMIKYKVNGLMQEFSDLIPPFKTLI